MPGLPWFSADQVFPDMCHRQQTDFIEGRYPRFDTSKKLAIVINFPVQLSRQKCNDAYIYALDEALRRVCTLHSAQVHVRG